MQFPVGETRRTEQVIFTEKIARGQVNNILRLAEGNNFFSRRTSVPNTRRRVVARKRKTDDMFVWF